MRDNGRTSTQDRSSDPVRRARFHFQSSEARQPHSGCSCRQSEHPEAASILVLEQVIARAAMGMRETQQVEAARNGLT